MQDDPIKIIVRIRPDDQGPDNNIGSSAMAGQPVKSLRQVSKAAQMQTSGNYQKSMFHATMASIEHCVEFVDDNAISITKPDGYSQPKQYLFERVCGGETSQEEMFANVSEYVYDTMNGFNTTVFTFGSTGSGKTYTMFGDPGKEMNGIVPKAISEMFMIMDVKKKKEAGRMFYIEATFVELYNNSFRNLLLGVVPEDDSAENDNNSHNSSAPAAASSGFRKLESKKSFILNKNASTTGKIEIHESKNFGYFLSGGTNIRVPINTASEAISLVSQASKNRVSRPLESNEHSSR